MRSHLYHIGVGAVERERRLHLVEVHVVLVRDFVDRVELHVDAGDDGDTHRYWDATGDVLPASGTTVRVETADGERVLTETYKSGR